MPAEPREKLAPSPVHIDIGWRSLLAKEDKTFARLMAPQGARPSAAWAPVGLAAFAKGVRDDGDGGGWRTACRDPAVAAAMRHLRRRVAVLSDLSTVPESEWAARMMNGRDGRAVPQRQQEFRTSTTHPLAYSELFPSPNREAPSTRQPDSTSLWCSSWGAAANVQPLDLTYKYDRDAINRCGDRDPSDARSPWGAGLSRHRGME